MINLNKLKTIKRITTKDNRNFKIGIRSDRNEKVENWPTHIFKKIFKSIKPHEFTAYYNTTDLIKLNYSIAKFLNISVENFIINHGGDGVIKEFLLVNYKKNLKVILNGNNYEMYKVYFKGLNIKYYETPYKINLQQNNIVKLDLKYFNKNIKKSDIIFITNPNQVSNCDFKPQDILQLCKKYPKKLFFIDESYYGFGHYTLTKYAVKIKNLYVMRSITKTFGLASARIGFLISHKNSIKSFKALQTPYPVSLFSGKSLEYFLKNISLIKEYNYRVQEGRELFCKELIKKGYLINNGMGLSVLIYFKSSIYLNKIYLKLSKKKLYTKKLKINTSNFLRVTCAPKNIMQKFIKLF